MSSAFWYLLCVSRCASDLRPSCVRGVKSNLRVEGEGCLAHKKKEKNQTSKLTQVETALGLDFLQKCPRECADELCERLTIVETFVYLRELETLFLPDLCSQNGL